MAPDDPQHVPFSCPDFAPPTTRTLYDRNGSNDESLSKLSTDDIRGKTPRITKTGGYGVTAFPADHEPKFDEVWDAGDREKGWC